MLTTIYEEACADSDLGPALRKVYPKLEDLRRDVPRLILARNLHGIDIDLRASQIAALALWLRCQRAYQEMGLKKDRPKITRSNFVCAEPMPGEEELLDEFLKTLNVARLEELMRRALNLHEGIRIRAHTCDGRQPWRACEKRLAEHEVGGGVRESSQSRRRSSKDAVASAPRRMGRETPAAFA